MHLNGWVIALFGITLIIGACAGKELIDDAPADDARARRTNILVGQHLLNGINDAQNVLNSNGFVTISVSQLESPTKLGTGLFLRGNAGKLEYSATGAAGSWQLTNMAPRALKGDFDPGFYVKHFVKDMQIAHNVASKNDLELPMLDAVLAQYEKMAENGMGNDGTQALIKLYDENK